MRKLHKLILSGALIPRKKSGHSLLRTIDLLQVPIVQNQPQEFPANRISFGYLHYDNRCTLDDLSFYLKQAFLQDVNIHDMFDSSSQTYRVYTSLSKLDKIKLINNYYLEERNISGLRQLRDSLNTIIYE
ncbi:TPA: hypothetical protein QFT03_002826 [Kluyvera ascorbata]|uniref:hypothetical protein n=1 Tax=Kluyvera TaxID=579 RepID=UPI00200F4942|nr:hypothetical protein [Kluyvera ascorbata]HDT6545842.1 hypothetical protein [Kluyvera ascorbata]